MGSKTQASRGASRAGALAAFSTREGQQDALQPTLGETLSSPSKMADSLAAGTPRQREGMGGSLDAIAARTRLGSDRYAGQELSRLTVEPDFNELDRKSKEVVLDRFLDAPAASTATRLVSELRDHAAQDQTPAADGPQESRERQGPSRGPA